MKEISRGSRSDSDDHPRLMCQGIRTPEGVPASTVPPRESATSATPCWGRIQGEYEHPGYSSLLLLDPGLISSIPAGIKNFRAGFLFYIFCGNFGVSQISTKTQSQCMLPSADPIDVVALMAWHLESAATMGARGGESVDFGLFWGGINLRFRC